MKKYPKKDGAATPKRIKRAKIVEVAKANRKKPSLTGATSQKDQEWVFVERKGRGIWLQVAGFATGAAQRELSLAGLNFIGKSWAALQAQVDDFDVFPRRTMLEEIGWSGSNFVLPNGEVVAPTGKKAPVFVGDADPQKCSTAGTQEGWQDALRLIADQTVIAFLVLIGFAPHLLKLTSRTDNFGFEVVGPRGIGKSTAQRIMASVAGAATDCGTNPYWITFNTTVNGTEATMRAHNDNSIILEEANLFAAGETARGHGRKLMTLIFNMSAGFEKARHTAKPPRSGSRFIYVSSANEPMSEVVQGGLRTADAAEDRLLTLNISPQRPYGVFDSLPPGFSDSGALADALTAAVSQHYGVAIRPYIQGLVNDRARDEKRLRKRIADDMAEFRRHAKVNPNDGSARRVTDAFGIAYAAGSLAQRYGALPKEFRCGPIALKAYRLHLRSVRKGPTFWQRVLKLARSPQAVNLDKAGYREMTKEELEAIPAFLRTEKTGRSTVLLMPEVFRREFPEGEAVFKDHEVQHHLIREGRHRTVNRPVRLGKVDRVLCFRLDEPKNAEKASKKPKEARTPSAAPKGRETAAELPKGHRTRNDQGKGGRPAAKAKPAVGAATRKPARSGKRSG